MVVEDHLLVVFLLCWVDPLWLTDRIVAAEGHRLLRPLRLLLVGAPPFMVLVAALSLLNPSAWVSLVADALGARRMRTP